MPTRAALFACAAAVLCGLPAAAQEWASSYTRHDYAKCRKAKPDEGGVSVRHCAGKAGIVVIWTAGDDASAVGFGAKPLDEAVVEKTGFFEAGNTVEWRGPKGGRPRAAILRYAAGQRIGKLDRSLLLVYRLGADGTSCIIGSVDARAGDANARARRLADEEVPGFRCGQDQRIER